MPQLAYKSYHRNDTKHLHFRMEAIHEKVIKINFTLEQIEQRIQVRIQIRTQLRPLKCDMIIGVSNTSHELEFYKSYAWLLY